MSVLNEQLLQTFFGFGGSLLDRTAPLPKFYFRPGTKQTLLEEALTRQLLDPKQTERP